jgi:septum formation protein
MYINKLNNYRLILGSKSPRRQFLMRELGLKFRVLTREISEDYPPELRREEIPLFLCEHKAQAFDDVVINEQTILITADTIVWLENQNIGKPANHQQAVEFLKMLSGKKHEVLTGVCLKSKFKTHAFHVCSEVYFNHLRLEEIEYYVKHFKPFDKAGAYGIQEWIGYVAIERINGSFYNVMGLPIQRLYNELLNFTGISA